MGEGSFGSQWWWLVERIVDSGLATVNQYKEQSIAVVGSVRSIIGVVVSEDSICFIPTPRLYILRQLL